ncbi:restriction endonuclease subunit S [Treponema sp. OttesenSCG-928-L16]|nr:restriction endonuclease subunit S [Treponema sp. OttesenSCG-928-L16]
MVGWKKKKLGDIAKICMCKRIFSEQTVQSGEIPFYKIGTLGEKPDTYISCTLYNEYRSKYPFPNKGDILLSAAGTLGKTVIYDGKPAYFQDSNIVWLEVDRKQICNDFLYFCYQVMEWSSPEGSTISRLYNGIIQNTNVNLPPLPEQRAIAAALSDADSYIDALERLIVKKRNIKKGAMQELLRPKDGWEAKKISGCLDKIIGGGTPSRYTSEYWNGSIPWATVKDFATFNNRQTQEYISAIGLVNSATHLIPKGTPIIATRMGLGKIAVYDIDVAINQDLKALFVNSETYSPFLVYWFKYNSKRVEELGTGSTVKGIRIEQLIELPIYIPSYDEQTAIATILSDMDAEIDALTAQLTKAKRIKQGMMQELLTGRIRLVTDEFSDTAKQESKVTPFPIAEEKSAMASSNKKHNQQFDDAVMIAGIVNALYSDKHPLGRKKVQKCLYLLRRHQDESTKSFKKKAAGPYADEVRYKGGEPIAQSAKYIATTTTKGKGTIFACGSNIKQALEYIVKWGNQADIQWVTDKLKYRKVDDLELLATVDMAICDLEEAGIPVSVASIRNLIAANKEWKEKLSKPIFSDTNIARAISELPKLL